MDFDVVGVSQTLRLWTEDATYIRQGGHHVGHWPTFLVATHALAVGPWSCSFYWCSIVCGWEIQISTTWCASMVQAELSPSYKLYSFKHLSQNRMLRSLWLLPFMASAINFMIFPLYVILLCSVEYSESSLHNCFLIVNRCLLVSWIRCCIGEPA